MAEHARVLLGEKVSLRCADGYEGWPEEAPFDAMIGTCAPEEIPSALTDQLADGGRMILPVGHWVQNLVMLRKRDGKIIRENDLSVRFVRMLHGCGP